MKAKPFTSLLVAATLILGLAAATYSQAPKKPAAGPTVFQLDLEGFKKVVRPQGRPMLINFWATWCDPCREEFPDLVMLHKAHRDKIDFLTVSLDDVSDIATVVPKFLGEMRSEMPAYLLKVPDEGDAVSVLTDTWGGNLPLTILIDAKGRLLYQRNGKIKVPELVVNLEKAAYLSAAPVYVVLDFVKIKDGRAAEADFFYENNWKLYREAAKKKALIDSYEIIKAEKPGGSYDILLVTRYRGKEQFETSEKNFEPILKELRPDGPKLLNALTPNEFRENVFTYAGPQVPAAN